MKLERERVMVLKCISHLIAGVVAGFVALGSVAVFGAHLMPY
jgi:hypothetical protein